MWLLKRHQNMYVLSSEKLNPERRSKDDVNEFLEINIRHTFFDKRESKSWKQDAESGKQDTKCMRIGRRS